LGFGYVAMIRGMLSVWRPDFNVRITNRGVGGDRTAELLARWKSDCLDLKPDVLSVMVGVNDVWRLMGEWKGQKHIPPAEFRANCTRLLEQASAAGIRQLVLVSPTTITPENRSSYNDLLAEYADATRELAGRFGGIYVPARDALLAARAALPEVEWTSDGCHPVTAGHAVIAAAWLKAVGIP
jgi:lysophospholipase L1-like esterase